MRVIGHRGAAGVELGNTMASLKSAREMGVYGVEFDVRLTHDRQLVLSHDDDMIDLSGSNVSISESSLASLRKIKLKNGEVIATLREALRELTGTLAIVDIKSDNCVLELLDVLDEFPNSRITISTFHHHFAAELEKLRPDLHIFLAENTRPMETLRMVRTAKADGLSLNARLLNPFNYWLARRHNFDVMIYTLNNRFLVWFIHALYPRVAICTDYPNRFIKPKRT